MLVSHLRLFATLAVAAAIGVSAQVEDLCMASCTVNSESPDTCPNSYVVFAHRHWTSFPHALFLLAPTPGVCAPMRPTRPQSPLVSSRNARKQTCNQPSNCSSSCVVCGARSALLCPCSDITQFSGSLSGSTSNSTSSTTSATSPGSSTTAPSSSTSSSPKKNGAVHDQLPFLNRAITFATIALGGALIL
jgi:hypothetical protein